MTVESDLFNTLKPLVSNRCFPDFAPLGTARPFITFEQVGGNALAYLDGALPNKKHGRFEVGVYADTRAACAALALQVEAALSAATVFQATAINAPVSDYAPEPKIYASTQTFSVFSDR